MKLPKSFKKKNEEKADKKEFKFKKKVSLWEKVFNKNKLKKPKKVAVLFLRKNKVAEPMELQPDSEGKFHIESKIYHQHSDCEYTLGKDRFPLAIIREWDMFPIGNKNWYDRNIRERFSELQRHAMRGIRYAERVRMGDKESRTITPKHIVLYVIIAIIATAVFVGYLQ